MINLAIFAHDCLENINVIIPPPAYSMTSSVTLHACFAVAVSDCHY